VIPHRRLLALTFFGGSIGTAAELLLLNHTEGVWQITPLLLLAAGCVMFLAVAATSHLSARRTFLALMLVFGGSGLLGAALHYEGNAEFARELDPEVSGLALVREAMTGATPALAPGAMLLLAAVGWAWGRVDDSGAA
jgi:hypothetical protein